MADVLTDHANILRASIARLKSLYPELEEDDELLADMVEGSTTFDNVMDRLAVAFMSKVALKEANGAVVASLKERAARFERGAEAYKALMQDVMESAGMRKAVLPSATVYLAKSRPALIVDEDFNAQGYVRVKTEPMKADILAALSAGDHIPGARLETVADHLVVRTS
jgi:hypothetical protein